jgi:hypothetical protein
MALKLPPTGLGSGIDKDRSAIMLNIPDNGTQMPVGD